MKTTQTPATVSGSVFSKTFGSRFGTEMKRRICRNPLQFHNL